MKKSNYKQKRTPRASLASSITVIKIHRNVGVSLHNTGQLFQVSNIPAIEPFELVPVPKTTGPVIVVLSVDAA
jgi:hypothetical protein